MAKKKIINIGFNDQDGIQYRNKYTGVKFYPLKSTQDSRIAYQKQNSGTIVKTFGDNRENTLNPNSAINFKNDYERNIINKYGSRSRYYSTNY